MYNINGIDLRELVRQANGMYGYVHQSTEFLEVLSWVSSKNFNGFMEIGSANGGTFHCWSTIINKGPKISVDANFSFGMGPESHETTKPFISEEESVPVQNRNRLWRENFEDIITIAGDSKNIDTVNRVEAALNGRKVDFLFIDGDHSYNGISSDFYNYRKFVSDDGYIGFHDIHEDLKPEVGCVQFWGEICKAFPLTIDFRAGIGIGIVKPQAQIEYLYNVR